MMAQIKVVMDRCKFPILMLMVAAAFSTLTVDAATTQAHHTSSPKETDTLESGEPIMAIVSIKSQQIKLYDADGSIMQAPVSTGTEGRETPAGIFAVLEKNKEHRSNMYDDAEMPNMHRITWNGIALHGGPLPGYPASHGCVRMPYDFAGSLFDKTRIGMRVIISPNDATPIEFSHPVLFSPNADVVAAAPKRADTLAQEAGEAAEAVVVAKRTAKSLAREARLLKASLPKLKGLNKKSQAKLRLADKALLAADEALMQAEEGQRKAADKFNEQVMQLDTTILDLKVNLVATATDRAVKSSKASLSKQEGHKELAEDKLSRANEVLLAADQTWVLAGEGQRKAADIAKEQAMQLETAKSDLKVEVAAAAAAKDAVKAAKIGKVPLHKLERRKKIAESKLRGADKALLAADKAKTQAEERQRKAADRAKKQKVQLEIAKSNVNLKIAAAAAVKAVKISKASLRKLDKRKKISDAKLSRADKALSAADKAKVRAEGVQQKAADSAEELAIQIETAKSDLKEMVTSAANVKNAAKAVKSRKVSLRKLERRKTIAEAKLRRANKALLAAGKTKVRAEEVQRKAADKAEELVMQIKTAKSDLNLKTAAATTAKNAVKSAKITKVPLHKLKNRKQKAEDKLKRAHKALLAADKAKVRAEGVQRKAADRAIERTLQLGTAKSDLSLKIAAADAVKALKISKASLTELERHNNIAEDKLRRADKALLAAYEAKLRAEEGQRQAADRVKEETVQLEIAKSDLKVKRAAATAAKDAEKAAKIIEVSLPKLNSSKMMAQTSLRRANKALLDADEAKVRAEEEQRQAADRAKERIQQLEAAKSDLSLKIAAATAAKDAEKAANITKVPLSKLKSRKKIAESEYSRVDKVLSAVNQTKMQADEAEREAVDNVIGRAALLETAISDLNLKIAALAADKEVETGKESLRKLEGHKETAKAKLVDADNALLAADEAKDQAEEKQRKAADNVKESKVQLESARSDLKLKIAAATAAKDAVKAANITKVPLHKLKSSKKTAEVKLRRADKALSTANKTKMEAEEEQQKAATKIKERTLQFETAKSDLNLKITAAAADKEVKIRNASLRKLEGHKETADAKLRGADKALLAADEAKVQAEEGQRMAADRDKELAMQIESAISDLKAKVAAATKAKNVVEAAKITKVPLNKLKKRKKIAEDKLRSADKALLAADESLMRAEKAHRKAADKAKELASQLETAKSDALTLAADAATKDIVKSAKIRKKQESRNKIVEAKLRRAEKALSAVNKTKVRNEVKLQKAADKVKERMVRLKTATTELNLKIIAASAVKEVKSRKASLRKMEAYKEVAEAKLRRASKTLQAANKAKAQAEEGQRKAVDKAKETTEQLDNAISDLKVKIAAADAAKEAVKAAKITEVPLRKLESRKKAADAKLRRASKTLQAADKAMVRAGKELKKATQKVKQSTVQLETAKSNVNLKIAAAAAVNAVKVRRTSLRKLESHNETVEAKLIDAEKLLSAANKTKMQAEAVLRKATDKVEALTVQIETAQSDLKVKVAAAAVANDAVEAANVTNLSLRKLKNRKKIAEANLKQAKEELSAADQAKVQAHEEQRNAADKANEQIAELETAKTNVNLKIATIAAVKAVKESRASLHKMESRKDTAEAKLMRANKVLAAANKMKRRAEDGQRKAADKARELTAQFDIAKSDLKAQLAAVTAVKVPKNKMAPLLKLERLKDSAEEKLKLAHKALSAANQDQLQAQEVQRRAADKAKEQAAQLDSAKSNLKAMVVAAAAAKDAIKTAKSRKAMTAKSAFEAKLTLEPVSVYISRRTQKLYVRRNTNEPAPDGGGVVFDTSIEVPVSIRNPNKPIGTHVFTAMEHNGMGMRWTAVTINNVEDARGALDRITIPQDVLNRIAPAALPRSSIIISDEPLSEETNYRTEFVTVLKHQPHGGFLTRKAERARGSVVVNRDEPTPGPSNSLFEIDL